VRGVVAELHGSDEAVSSPTFVFRQRYDAPDPAVPSIEHVDLFRIADPAAELPELALDDAFGPDSIALVEWPDRAEDWLPAGRIEVTIDGLGEGPRTVRIARPGTR
jgi:tRNA threonylcarbamoyl adenosine modification protein YjeE